MPNRTSPITTTPATDTDPPDPDATLFFFFWAAIAVGADVAVGCDTAVSERVMKASPLSVEGEELWVVDVDVEVDVQEDVRPGRQVMSMAVRRRGGLRACRAEEKQDEGSVVLVEEVVVL